MLVVETDRFIMSHLVEQINVYRSTCYDAGFFALNQVVSLLIVIVLEVLLFFSCSMMMSSVVEFEVPNSDDIIGKVEVEKN